MPKLIILRGNSGSGKNTVAKMIAQSANHKIAIIDADAYRVDMLFPKPIHKDDFEYAISENSSLDETISFIKQTIWPDPNLF